jgi:cytochrome c biogenesis protein
MQRFLKALRSMKLAVVLIAYLAAAGTIATLVPQGREAAYYTSAYPKLVAELLLQSGFTRFFTSLLFFLPALLFFLNLSACTIYHLVREIRKPGKRRYGPDILHLGLMLLVVGSVMSFSGRQQGSISLSVGEGVELPDGRVMELKNFEFLKYEDGRPRDWISTVDVRRDGKAEISSYPIRVNHPLKLGEISIYQMSHSSRRVLGLRVPSGGENNLAQGEQTEQDGVSVFFMAVEEASGRAILRVVDSSGASTVARATVGDEVGPFTIVALRDIDVTGLEAIVDPGYGLVVVALLLIACGVFLTFIQKLGDIKP